MRSQDGRGQDNGLPSVPGLPARRSWHGAGTKREATRLKGSGGKSREGGGPSAHSGGLWGLLGGALDEDSGASRPGAHALVLPDAAARGGHAWVTSSPECLLRGTRI